MNRIRQPLSPLATPVLSRWGWSRADADEASRAAAAGDPGPARLLAARLAESGDGGGRPPTAGEIHALLILTAFLGEALRHAGWASRSGSDALWRRIGAAAGESEVTEIRQRLEAAFAMPVSAPSAEESSGKGAAPAGDADIQEQQADILLHLALLPILLADPALAAVRLLLRIPDVDDHPAFPDIAAAVRSDLATLPGLLPGDRNLQASLDSLGATGNLADRLRRLASVWAPLLGLDPGPLLLGCDLLAEESRPGGDGGNDGGNGGGGEAPVISFGGAEPDCDTAEERYSRDEDWMPELVLLAKNAHVWLDQLAREYRREVHRLDQIPDAELDRMAARGFTGLWLIGIWERSAASARIKQATGNTEAIASAYALAGYRIADDLGGEAALEDLKERAGRRGIRLAGDMVPNHTGLDAGWVLDHPERFLGLDNCPYPAYRFDGPDLSPREDVSIRIEDGYYDHRDAAVVFQRVDNRSGAVRYIYHGNDGTSMPWNDTAQLDYLNPETREAVIGKVLEVARRFPVIRFDAAMVLARRHVRRLWHPEPGAGDAIPSRAEHPMDAADFAAAMPREFWREVVERIESEAPGTLLLAEAFWMLEGYFVRTLGMHRVYNSAFMNMLRDEKNADFRASLRNVLEYDPRILERFVNFLNNPDEQPAAVQFGKGDKYFGICIMMSTLPGLPLFGHGQVEGLSEKYGMEFRRAGSDESPDEGFIAHHERVVFPLLRRRGLFAGVDGFRLYDAERRDGGVDENIFAYSNRRDGERALVVYNNHWERASVRIRNSTGFRPAGSDPEAPPRRESLAEGLELRAADAESIICRDMIGGREIAAPARTLREEGLALELGGYECLVLTGFRAEAQREAPVNPPRPPADKRPGGSTADR